MRPCPNCKNTTYKLRYFEEPYKVLKCRKCNLVYLGNPPDENILYENYHETTEIEFDEYSSISSAKHVAELYSINQQRLNWIFKKRKAGTLLDVGCGRGYFLKTMADAGFEVYGIDVSATAVNYTKKQFSLQASTLTLDDLVKSGAKYDIITLWHVLEHFIDLYAELEKLHGLLNESGLCFIEVPNLHSLKFMMAKQKWQGGNHPKYHRTFFTTQTLNSAILKAGFSNCRRVRISYKLPGNSNILGLAKPVLNLMGMDSFVDVIAYK